LSAETLPKVTIYTDGACEPNPGPGGWGALLIAGGTEKTINGGDRHTTNNRMELTAAVEALRALKRPCEVTLYTDSQYLKRGVTEWMPGWIKRGWKRKEGVLANAELWQTLAAEISRHHIEWRWLRGHTGQPENERVDQLAKAGIPKR
jgi:ribonuclease HI